MFPINIKTNYMNAKRKEKAVKDFVSFSSLGNEELTQKLIEAGYDEEKEIPEIIESILECEKTPVIKFKLSELFETEMEDGEEVFSECENWKKYQKEAEKHYGSKQIDYIKVNAVGCFRVKENSKGIKVPYMVGLKCLKEKVIHTTRIEPRIADSLNAQIWNVNNIPECSVYYLVKSLIEL